MWGFRQPHIPQGECQWQSGPKLTPCWWGISSASSPGPLWPMATWKQPTKWSPGGNPFANSSRMWSQQPCWAGYSCRSSRRLKGLLVSQFVSTQRSIHRLHLCATSKWGAAHFASSPCCPPLSLWAAGRSAGWRASRAHRADPQHMSRMHRFRAFQWYLVASAKWMHCNAHSSIWLLRQPTLLVKGSCSSATDIRVPHGADQVVPSGSVLRRTDSPVQSRREGRSGKSAFDLREIPWACMSLLCCLLRYIYLLKMAACWQTGASMTLRLAK